MSNPDDIGAKITITKKFTDKYKIMESQHQEIAKRLEKHHQWLIKNWFDSWETQIKIWWEIFEILIEWDWFKLKFFWKDKNSIFNIN